MQTFTVQSIGTIRKENEMSYIELLPEYREGLAALEGFGHIQVLWWAHLNAGDPPLQVARPYRTAPPQMGVFATRSPARPNSIGLTACAVWRIEPQEGRLWLGYIDAEEGTPVLDIKPYTPSLDRVETPEVPAWCAHWPRSLEGAAEFDWPGEFV